MQGGGKSFKNYSISMRVVNKKSLIWIRCMFSFGKCLIPHNKWRYGQLFGPLSKSMIHVKYYCSGFMAYKLWPNWWLHNNVHNLLQFIALFLSCQIHNKLTQPERIWFSETKYESTLWLRYKEIIEFIVNWMENNYIVSIQSNSIQIELNLRNCICLREREKKFTFFGEEGFLFLFFNYT